MVLLSMLSAVADSIKSRPVAEKAIIDQTTFRAHYKLTLAILFACSIMATAFNLFGDAMNCITDGLPEHVVNTYCLISNTYTLYDKMDKKDFSVRNVYRGISTHVENEDTTREHSYYQWVPLVLFFQGVLFYIPRWLWKNWEGGKVQSITNGVRGFDMVKTEEKQIRLRNLVGYLVDSLHMHNFYFSFYFICEVLNLLNVIGNFFLINSFLGGHFYMYGINVIKSLLDNTKENFFEPMETVFPRMAKCTFQKYGSSGTIEKHDALCVMALNNLNEKIYLFLWFWFAILAMMSTLALLYTIACVFLPVRKIIIRFRFRSPQSVLAVIEETQIGDFFLLHLLGQNMSHMQFSEILEKLNSRLNINENLQTSGSSVQSTSTDSWNRLTIGQETET